MNIEFSVESIDGFLPSLAKGLQVQYKKEGFELPAILGEGYFRQYRISTSIHIIYYKVNLSQELSIIRNKSKNTDLFPITFWLSSNGIQQELNTHKKVVGATTQNGIFFPSNSIETQYHFPKNTVIENVTVFVDRSWLKENINPQEDYINAIILKKPIFFLYEVLGPTMSDTLKKVKHHLLNLERETVSKLALFSATLLLLEQFFTKIQDRGSTEQYHQLNPAEIEKIFKVKEIITDNFTQVPLIKDIAKMVGMNDRKMQNIFKQIFGFSIYQYGLSIKMNRAKELLSSPDYNVAEVGHLMGYSNLSHFTEQFKKSFGITPKVYQKKK